MDNNQVEKLISENINQENALNELNNITIIKELINSLKEKINIYEKQIKKLIDDKVKLQMDMNSIILQNLSLKKKNNSIQNIENSKEEEPININTLNLTFSTNDIVNNNNKNNNHENIILSSLIDINKKLLEQNKELKNQVDIFKSNIDIYKQKIIALKENNSNKKCKFCEEKKLELIKMASEKEEIFNSIKSLRKQLDELKLNEKIKKEKKRKQKIEKNESLPNIEQYFIVNNKFQLVDSNKNLWHMKKCMKFQEFKKKYEKNNLSPDDLLKEFVETYEIKLDDDFNEENEFLEGLNSSERGNENTRKKYENKYMPPLPGMSNTSNKKKNSSENNELINNDDSEINVNNNININSEDIQINIDENEKEENKYDKENKENKEIKNEEKKNENDDNNININNNNNNNEIKEETSFNLSDNTD